MVEATKQLLSRVTPAGWQTQERFLLTPYLFCNSPDKGENTLVWGVGLMLGAALGV